MAIICKNNVIDAMGFYTQEQLEAYLTENDVTLQQFVEANGYESYDVTEDGFLVLVDADGNETVTHCEYEEDEEAGGDE